VTGFYLIDLLIIWIYRFRSVSDPIALFMLASNRLDVLAAGKE